MGHDMDSKQVNFPSRKQITKKHSKLKNQFVLFIAAPCSK